MKKEEKRGRPIECRYCGAKFKIINKEERKQWIENLFPCPSCNILYSYMTEIEKQLQIIQAKFKNNNKDEKYLKEMFDVLVVYAESIIKKHYINEIYDKSLLSTYAKSAASLLIESDFYKKENFSINSSFGSRLQKKCIQALRSKKESYERISIDDSLDYIFQDGNYIEHEDKSTNEFIKIEQQEEKILLLQKICKMIFEFENYCESQFENYVRLINILNYLRGGERAIDNFFEVYGRYGKYKTLQSLSMIKKEINERNILEKTDNKRIIKSKLTHEDIISNKFKINSSWQKVSLVSKDKDAIYYFFNGGWREKKYFDFLEIKK